MNIFLKIGTDAEYFVRNSDGVIASAIGMLGGSKDEPRIVPKGNLQEDNVLAEFAIDPVVTKEQWLTSITDVTTILRDVVHEKNLSLVCRSSHTYNKELLLSFPPAAMEMGCSPDFDVYALRDNESPSPMTRLRTAAAHVHFSYVKPNEETTVSIIKAMDYVLGLWSVIEDEDEARRSLYGKAGSCRLKSYGGEYRTLGNFWLRSSFSMEYVYDMTKLCVAHADEIVRRCSLVLPETQLQAIINSCDKPAASLHYSAITDIVAEIQTNVREESNVKLSA